MHLTCRCGKSQLCILTIPNRMDIWTTGITPNTHTHKHATLTLAIYQHITKITHDHMAWSHTARGKKQTSTHYHRCRWTCTGTYTQAYIPVIISVFPVVKVNEETVVDDSSDSCHTYECGVLPVHCLQLHSRTESRGCYWLINTMEIHTSIN